MNPYESPNPVDNDCKQSDANLYSFSESAELWNVRACWCGAIAFLGMTSIAVGGGLFLWACIFASATVVFSVVGVLLEARRW